MAEAAVLADAEYRQELIADAKRRVEEIAQSGLLRKGCSKLRSYVQFTKAWIAAASVERDPCTKRRREMIVGYARVSTDGQTLDAQQAALREAGAQRVFSEKQSGVKTDRAALARCLRGLEAGDVVLVTKLDRLARSTRDLLNTLATIGEAGASFRSLGDPWADTTSAHSRLMLTGLGGLAGSTPSDPEPNR